MIIAIILFTLMYSVITYIMATIMYTPGDRDLKVMAIGIISFSWVVITSLIYTLISLKTDL